MPRGKPAPVRQQTRDQQGPGPLLFDQQRNFNDEQGNFRDGKAKVRGQQVNPKSFILLQIEPNPVLPRERCKPVQGLANYSLRNRLFNHGPAATGREHGGWTRINPARLMPQPQITFVNHELHELHEKMFPFV